jgi:hypothetical protein
MVVRGGGVVIGNVGVFYLQACHSVVKSKEKFFLSVIEAHKILPSAEVVGELILQQCVHRWV